MMSSEHFKAANTDGIYYLVCSLDRMSSNNSITHAQASMKVAISVFVRGGINSVLK